MTTIVEAAPKAVDETPATPQIHDEYECARPSSLSSGLSEC